MIAATYSHQNTEIVGIVLVVLFLALLWIWALRDPAKRRSPDPRTWQHHRPYNHEEDRDGLHR